MSRSLTAIPSSNPDFGARMQRIRQKGEETPPSAGQDYAVPAEP